MLKFIFKILFKLFYRIKIEGLENYPKTKGNLVIIANHISFLDAAIISVFLPQKPFFGINTHIAKLWWVRPFLKLVKTYPLDPTNPLAMKHLISKVKQGEHCAIFPEGRITVTGSLMRVYDGPGMIADKADAMILPIRIEGAEYTLFSRLRGVLPRRLFGRVKLSILPAVKLSIPQELRGKKRRVYVGRKLYDLMVDVRYKTANIEENLFASILKQAKIYGANHKIIEDVNRKPVSYKKLIIGSFILGSKFEKHSSAGEYIGVMMPSVCSTIVAFFGLSQTGRIPAMLNFSTGKKNLLATIETAGVKIVYSSKKFIKQAKLEEIEEAIKQAGIKIYYLEDIAKQISLASKLKALCKYKFRLGYVKKNLANASSVACVLFTSGSEGVPKAVVLSHKNIQANLHQLSSRIDFNAKDIVFNTLPLFHSFGLTAGTLLPLLFGIRTFFYPSPLHYRIVPELIYSTNATIFFGTDTFLAGYARFAHPYNLRSIRYIFAGAEKLKQATQSTYNEKYGIRIFEGYGATECSPVISSNTPMLNKAGSVGCVMPGMQYHIKPIEGIAQGGELIVKGDNVMMGYFKHDRPKELQPLPSGSYATGDIVEIDEEGFVFIKGRAKRFAKIAGEMVSLTAVEGYVKNLFPNSDSAIIAVPDSKKGEQLKLFITKEGIQRAEISSYFKENGISELALPKYIEYTPHIPILGTGKIDYNSLK